MYIHFLPIKVLLTAPRVTMSHIPCRVLTLTLSVGHSFPAEYVIYDNIWQLDQWHDNTHCIQVTIVNESEYIINGLEGDIRYLHPSIYIPPY